MSQVSLVPILLWVAALACAGVAIWREPRPVLRGFVDRSAAALSVPVSARTPGPVGLYRPSCSLPSSRRPRSAGPPAPFQYEVGVANLGLGLAAIYAAFKGFEARLAVAIVGACFLIGAGIVHISRYRRTGQSRAGQCRADPGHRFSDAARHPRAAGRSPARNGGRNRRPRSRLRPSLTSPARRCAITALP